MGFSKSVLAFDDVREVFDRALEHEQGLRVKFETHGRAVAARHRFNSFRKGDRAENRTIYPEDHQLYGRSVYDKLVLRIPKKGDPNDCYLYLEKRSAKSFEIEELSPEIELDTQAEKS